MQPSNPIPGVIVAKPSPLSPGSSAAPMIKSSTGSTNLIFKGRTIPLVLEKSKSDNSTTPTSSASTPALSPSKVPNILRGTSSPSKNTIERQIVSHEATIELRKNCNILSRPSNNVQPSANNSTIPVKDSLTVPMPGPVNGKLVSLFILWLEILKTTHMGNLHSVYSHGKVFIETC